MTVRGRALEPHPVSARASDASTLDLRRLHEGEEVSTRAPVQTQTYTSHILPHVRNQIPWYAEEKVSGRTQDDPQ